MSYTPRDLRETSPWAAGPVEPVPSGQGGVGKTVAIVLLVMTLGMLMFVGALGGLIYLGLRQMAQPDSSLVLPQRSDRGGDDAAALAESLHRPGQTVHPEEAEIRQWLAAQIDRVTQGRALAPSEELFYAAVLHGPDGAQLNVLQRAHLRQSLRLGLPEPTVMRSYRVVDITPDALPETARVALWLYDSESLPFLQTWFLIKRQGQWQLYDWFEADYGRRRSDEYGNYCRELFDNHVEGYDEVDRLVQLAREAVDRGDETRGRQLLQQSETITTVPYDHDRALLTIGRGYQHLGDSTRAAEVLQSARRPEEVPGIWLSLGIGQCESENPEAAIATADRLRKLYPGHPAADFITARACQNLGRGSEAGDFYLRFLRQCPEDSTCFDWLMYVAEPRHAAEMVQAIRMGESAEDFLLRLLRRFENHPEMLAEIDAALVDFEKTPQAWKTMAEAAWQHAQGNTAEALDQLRHSRRQPGVSEELRTQQARWLVHWSLASGNLDALQQQADFEPLMRQAADELFAEVRYFVAGSLESALASLPETHQQLPAVLAMRGWAAWQEDRYEEAVLYLSSCLDVPAGPAAEEDDFREQVAWYLNNSLISLRRFEAALDRFGDDFDHCWEIVDAIFERRDREAAGAVGQRVAEARTPSEAMVRAAIEAMSASWQGSAQEADRHWIACLSEISQSEPESYALHAAARWRGRTAVHLNDAAGLLADVDAPAWESTVQAICRETAKLGDAELARAITAAATRKNSLTGPQEIMPWLAEAVAEMNADLAEQQHDWLAAARFRRQLLAADQQGWQAESHRRSLVQALLRSTSHDEAELTELLETLADDSLWASYCLARGRDREAREVLGKLDSRQRGYWYLAPANRECLLHDRDLADWLSDSDAPLVISYLSPTASAVLIEAPSRALTASELQAAVAAVLDTSASVREVPPRGDAHLQRRWVIHQEEGMDVVVSQGRGTFQSDAILPPPAAAALDENRHYIAIDVLRADQPPSQLALALAGRLASEATQLVQHGDSGFVWYPNDAAWADRLAWSGRLPIDADSAPSAFLYLSAEPSAPTADSPSSQDAPSEAAANEAIDLETVRARLEEEAEGFPVVLQIPAGYASERLAARVTGVDEPSSLVELELQEDSALLPALRAGHRLRANAYHLRRTRVGLP